MATTEADALDAQLECLGPALLFWAEMIGRCIALTYAARSSRSTVPENLIGFKATKLYEQLASGNWSNVDRLRAEASGPARRSLPPAATPSSRR